MNSWVWALCLPLICDVNRRSSEKGLGQSHPSCVAFAEVATPIITGQLHYLVDPGMFEMVKLFSLGGAGANSTRSQVFGTLNDAVAVWFSCPQRMLLQFIAGLFFFFLNEWEILFLNPETLGRWCYVIFFPLNRDMAECLVQYPGSWCYDIYCAMSETQRIVVILCEAVTLCLCTSDDVSETHLSWPQWLKRCC